MISEDFQSYNKPRTLSAGWLIDSQYEKFLKDIRELLKDKEKYIDTQREYIKKLKKDNN